MADILNFDRQYRFSAGQAGGSGFEVGESAQVPIPLHCEFSFQKTDLTSQNTGRVTLWNLNKSQIATLKEKDCAASFRAGYGKNLSLIFSGIISFSATSLDGADRKTEIEIIDNLVQIRDTFVSVSYNGTVNWKTIMDDTAAQMGVAVSYSYNASFVDIPNGFSYVGKAKDIMDKGCKCCGLTWSIQNGVMQVKKPGDVMSKEVYVLSPDTGLLGIPTSVVIAQDEATGQNQLGWDVEYFLNGAINVDDYVRVESKMVTGYFRVYSIDMAGDNRTGDWTCKARLLEVNG